LETTGVVKGWWAGRSRNTQTNRVFQPIHEILEEHDTVLTMRYVNTNSNPTNNLSRGKYPPPHLLPPIPIPDEIRGLITNFNNPPQFGERAPAPNLPSSSKAQLTPTERLWRKQANRTE
jgi:hypothetical protein